MSDRVEAARAHPISNPPSMERFRSLMLELTSGIGSRVLDPRLQHWLNQQHGADTRCFGEIVQACVDGIRDGWMCARERGGVRYGRVLKPAVDLHDFSVDVVDMADVVGPHHVHPAGEIDLVMPLTPGALFDGHGAGWLVYPPGSSHAPTVSEGHALVLYLLPQGSIEFTAA